MTNAKTMMLSRLEEIPAGIHVVIYGAGRQGHNLAQTLLTVRPDVRVEAFWDDSLLLPRAVPPVHRPGLAGSIMAKTDALIVPHNIYGQVRDRLNGCPIPVMVLPAEMNFTHCFLPSERASLSMKEKTVCSLLSQSDSNVFRKLMDARTVGYPSAAPEHYPAGGEIYLDYINRATVRTMISGGIGDGCVEMEMMRLLPALEIMIGFDPFADLYEQGSVKGGLDASGRFRFEPCGLGAKQETMYLHKKGQSSYVRRSPQAADDTAVSVTALDDYAKEKNLRQTDLIKLDVEGGEIEALKGAVGIIRSQRPFLAVCIYHDRIDMITVPLFLAEHLENYSFRLGHYSSGYNDTVFYALPNERD